MKKNLINLFVFAFLGIIIAFSAAADTTCYTFEVGIPFIKGFGAGECVGPAKLSTMIVKFIEILFPLAGILAFVMIVVAGFEYATSGGDTNKQKDAQDRIANAIIGLVLLFAFWVILNTINPDILKIQDLSLKSVTSPAIKQANMTKLNDFSIPLSYEFLSKGYSAYATFDLGDKLQALFTKTNKGTDPKWYITEACITQTLPCETTYNGHEIGSCHYDGTCVDIVLTNATDDNKQKFIDMAKSAGLSIYNEYDEKCWTAGTTGGHFHVALTCGSGSCWICP
ncbi:MAG: hypothetical protein GYA31_02505 [Parcubacteria group bacterium]|nr:hypothetical protein [Parcubacteria group bacterium]